MSMLNVQRSTHVLDAHNVCREWHKMTYRGLVHLCANLHSVAMLAIQLYNCLVIRETSWHIAKGSNRLQTWFVLHVASFKFTSIFSLFYDACVCAELKFEAFWLREFQACKVISLRISIKHIIFYKLENNNMLSTTEWSKLCQTTCFDLMHCKLLFCSLMILSTI